MNENEDELQEQCDKEKPLQVIDRRNPRIKELRNKLADEKSNQFVKQKMIDEAETKMFGAPLRNSVIWLPAIEYAGQLYPKDQYRQVYEELLGQGHAVQLDINAKGMWLEKKDENWKPKKLRKTYGINKKKNR